MKGHSVVQILESRDHQMEAQFARALEKSGRDDFRLLGQYQTLCHKEHDRLKSLLGREEPTSVTAFKLIHEKANVGLERDTWLLALRLLESRKQELPDMNGSLIPGYNTTVRELADHLLESHRHLKESSLGTFYCLYSHHFC